MWLFPRHKASVKCIHMRQGIRAISGKNTAFFPYASHADSVREGYQWALRASKRKRIARNAMCTHSGLICMHYTSRRGARNFIGVFFSSSMKKLRSRVWYGNSRFTAATKNKQRGPVPLYSFEVSEKVTQSLFEGSLKNPIDVLSCMKRRRAWRAWKWHCSSHIVRAAFGAWKRSGFVLL